MIRIAIACYVVATVSANLTAASFVYLPFGLVFAIGTLFFGVTFTARDLIHPAGRRVVYGTIAVAAIVNVAVALLTDTPLRIIAASFVTILLSESVDTEVFARLRDRPWLHRVIGSNSLSVPLDTLIFTTLAFAGDLPLSVLAGLMIGEVLWKYAASIVVAFPLWRMRPQTTESQL